MKHRIAVILVIFLTSCTTPSAWGGVPVKWSLPINGSGMTAQSGNLMTGFDRQSGKIITVDTLLNKIAWQKDLNNTRIIPYRQITMNDQAIFAYIPGQGLHVYSLTGELLSKIPAPSFLPKDSGGVYGAGPTLYQQNLYVPVDRFLFSYDISDPKALNFLWTRELLSGELAGSAFTALTVDERGIIYAGIAQKGSFSLQSLDPVNGQTLWTADTSVNNDPGKTGTPTALIVIGEKVIAAVLESSTIQAFERNTGERIYTSENLAGLCPDGAFTIESFDIGEGNLYMSPNAGTCVYGINAETGKVLWTHTSRVDPNTSFTYGGTPKYVNGVVYASNSALWALDAKTGKVLSISSNRDDDAIFTNVQYANGEILVWGKNLTAYKPIR